MGMVLKNKKILLALLIVLAGLGLIFHFTLAGNPTPVPSNAGIGQAGKGALTGFLTGFSSMGLVVAVLYSFNLILNALLGLAGSLLDYLFYLNLAAPIDIPQVLQAWELVRDIVNSLLILVILWIAFTFIFNIQNLGGQRLLVRIVMVALVINFSMVMVTALFSFTNALAAPFYTALNQGKISDFMAAGSKIHTTFATLDPSTLDDFKEELERLEAQTTTTQQSQGSSLGSSFASALGIKQAEAGFFIPFLIAWGPAIFAWAGGIVAGFTFFNQILALGLSGLMIFLLFSAFFSMIVLLGLRLMLGVFLSVLAPAALLLFALPGRFGQKYWDMWLSNLVNWAFLAPAFYFLLYVAMLMLNLFSTGALAISPIIKNLPIHADMVSMIGIIISLLFVFGAIFIARQMAGAIGETAIGYAKTGGKFVAASAAGGIMAVGARAIPALAAREGVQQALGRLPTLPVLRAIPGIGWTGAYAQRRLGAAIEKRGEGVEAEKAKVAAMKPDQLVGQTRAALTNEAKVGRAMAAAEKGRFGDFTLDEQRRLLELARRYNKQDAILKVAPHLLTPENVQGLTNETDLDKGMQKVMNKMAAEDRAKLKLSAMPPETQNRIKRNMLITLRGVQELAQVARENSDLYRDLIQYYDAHAPALTTELESMGTGRGTALQNIITRYRTGSPGGRTRGGRAGRTRAA